MSVNEVENGALAPVGELPKSLVGRLAGTLYLAGGLISMARLLLAPPHQYNRPGIMVVSAVAVFIGLLALSAPWDRWPRKATLVLAPIAFTLIALANSFGTDPFSFGIFFVVAFVWIGVSHPRGTSLAFAPLAAAAYLGSLQSGPFRSLGPTSTALTIPVCVLVGESLAFLGARAKKYARALRDERQVSHDLRALHEMKNTFLNAVSHELRTPLTSVLGFALTLEQNRDQLTPREHAEVLGRLAANARKLDRLLGDLLNLDRLNRGVLQPSVQPTRVDGLVRQVVGSMELDRQITLETEPVEVPVDPPKVERIVENLAANAAKYTAPATSVCVRVRRHDGGALVTVEDRGPGVPDALKEVIFEPFQRGEASDRAHPGTGIGLSLVKRFAELHEGRAWVADAAGGGAAFHVFLPGAVLERELPEAVRSPEPAKAV